MRLERGEQALRQWQIFAHTLTLSCGTPLRKRTKYRRRGQFHAAELRGWSILCLEAGGRHMFADVVGLLPAILTCGCLPGAIVWGWLRWLRRAQPRSLYPVLSLLGFISATASALLAISFWFYVAMNGGQFSDAVFIVTIRC